MTKHLSNSLIVRTCLQTILNISRDSVCRGRLGASGACLLAHKTLLNYYVAKDRSEHTVERVGAHDIDLQIGLLSLQVFVRLSDGNGSNCRCLLQMDIQIAIRDCLRLSLSCQDVITRGLLIVECSKLIYNLGHYTRVVTSSSSSHDRITVITSKLEYFFVTSDVLSLLLSALSLNVTAAHICEAGCAAISMTCYSNGKAQNQFSNSLKNSLTGCELLLNVLRHHAWLENVCVSCCLSIYAICEGI